MPRRVALLGSTGSIGENALRVCRAMPDRLTVTGVAAGRRAGRAAEQAADNACSWMYVADDAARAGVEPPPGCRLLTGSDDLAAAICADDVDTVLCAIVGTAGLAPVLAAIRAGKDIALASKEILVMAGDLVTREARRAGVRLLPVDSEHCAVFQCLEGEKSGALKRVILTASGGPFAAHPEVDLKTVTPEQALAHPTWNMGRKITIDSATLMNKGLEVIEARWLFDVGPDRLEVAIHPQSIVHSMVEFVDGSILAQLGHPDMCLPIQYCLTYPERCPSLLRPLDFSDALTLDFRSPDHDRFPALRLAQRALELGGTAPAAYNAANEVAVERFCAGDLPFPGIWAVVAAVLERLPRSSAADLSEILAADAEARRQASRIITP